MDESVINVLRDMFPKIEKDLIISLSGEINNMEDMINVLLELSNDGKPDVSVEALTYTNVENFKDEDMEGIGTTYQEEVNRGGLMSLFQRLTSSNKKDDRSNYVELSDMGNDDENNKEK
tara:strand:+ start:1008 stop:1364 length:357 start_codon:yes stop_codon:yes gene_type:complete